MDVKVNIVDAFICLLLLVLVQTCSLAILARLYFVLKKKNMHLVGGGVF